eukprot:COSAG01_NODE_13306_length_1604_cov_1.764120_2_plen_330_part_01
MVFTYEDLISDQADTRRNMRLPTNLMDCLRFVRESNLLGGQRGKPVDLWEYSLIFNQESRYQKTKENINCPAGHGVDFLVIDYYKYERDVAPVLEDPLWHLPTDGGEVGHVVGYRTYNFVDCRRMKKSMAIRPLPDFLRYGDRIIKLMQIVSKPRYGSVSAFDNHQETYLNRLAPHAQFLLAEPVDSAYASYMRKGMRFNHTTRIQPMNGLPTAMIEEYRGIYCESLLDWEAEHNEAFPTLVFKLHRLPIQQSTGLLYRILDESSANDEFEVMDIQQNIDLHAVMEDIYVRTADIAWLVCRQKLDSYTATCMVNLFGEPYETRNGKEQTW